MCSCVLQQYMCRFYLQECLCTYAMCCAMQQSSPPPHLATAAGGCGERRGPGGGGRGGGDRDGGGCSTQLLHDEEQDQEEEEAAPSSVPGVSQGRRREYGEYTMDARGRIVATDNASQQTCTLSHLPAKTSQLTHRYATRDDPAVFVTLAAQLMQCPATQQSNMSAATQLSGMVSRLVDTASVFQPPSPCAAPASTDTADLAAWDCSDHLMHVLRILQLVNRITIYHVGGFLRQVMATATTAQERHCVLMDIANTACNENSRQYQGILASCGCTECTLALQEVEGAGGGTLCRAAQVKTKFARNNLANLTPSFFHQCIQMHVTMPSKHVLFMAPVEAETLSPTHTWLLVFELHHVVHSLQQQGVALPLSFSQLGLWHHFLVATRHEEAVDLVDGDGGYLVVDHSPGLGEYLQQRVPAIM